MSRLSGRGTSPRPAASGGAIQFFVLAARSATCAKTPWSCLPSSWNQTQRGHAGTGRGDDGAHAGGGKGGSAHFGSGGRGGEGRGAKSFSGESAKGSNGPFSTSAKASGRAAARGHRGRLAGPNVSLPKNKNRRDGDGKKVTHDKKHQPENKRHARRNSRNGPIPSDDYEDCLWLRQKAIGTGNKYWWRRYNACRF